MKIWLMREVAAGGLRCTWIGGITGVAVKHRAAERKQGLERNYFPVVPHGAELPCAQLSTA